ncbi:MAG: choice-of-anchor D domain-containing protein [Burkholderiales bacterium]|nr:choice-of-anchor D domain-containing protein [Burkholderiales bacterium]
MAWGSNYFGQLGDSTNANHNSPVAVTGGLNLGSASATTLLSPISLAFAMQNMATSSAAQTLTLTNMDTVALSISRIAANGDYTRTTTCGSTLAAATSCSIDVTFTPTAVGTRNGSVGILSNGVLLNATTLSGTGVGAVVTLDASSLSFAAQNLGSISAAQTVTLFNTGGDALSLASIVATGDYTVTNDCDTGLGVGGFCTLSIRFSPTTTGSRPGTVVLTDNALNSPQTIMTGGIGRAARCR